jgi:hypothetical protein
LHWYRSDALTSCAAAWLAQQFITPMVEHRMTNEDEVLAALEKPLAVYALQQRVDPSSKSTDALQDLLMRMRAAGKVKFDIKTGKWSKA